uniref:Uncharacterized protein n=1 Tax=Takifugu rubripes TaxID=31033 RepID=A0A674MLG8_TAKRU
MSVPAATLLKGISLFRAGCFFSWASVGSARAAAPLGPGEPRCNGSGSYGENIPAPEPFEKPGPRYLPTFIRTQARSRSVSGFKMGQDIFK